MVIVQPKRPIFPTSCCELSLSPTLQIQKPQVILVGIPFNIHSLHSIQRTPSIRRYL